MSTRSKIGVLKENGMVDAIYCHWDGYPSYNGRMLVENYVEAEQIRKLISLGSISSLGKNLEQTNSYYGWREEESPKIVYANEQAFSESYGDCWDEYIYLFKENEWYVYDNDNEFDGWQKVKDILKEEE